MLLICFPTWPMAIGSQVSSESRSRRSYRGRIDPAAAPVPGATGPEAWCPQAVLFGGNPMGNLQFVSLHLTTNAFLFIGFERFTQEGLLLGSLLLDGAVNDRIGDGRNYHPQAADGRLCAEPYARHVIRIVADEELACGVRAAELHVGMPLGVEYLVAVPLSLDLNGDARRGELARALRNTPEHLHIVVLRKGRGLGVRAERRYISRRLIFDSG